MIPKMIACFEPRCSLHKKQQQKNKTKQNKKQQQYNAILN